MLKPRYSLGFAVVLAIAFACHGGAANAPIQPRALDEFLKAQNWIPLPIPDSKMRPGSIIKVTEKEPNAVVRWLGDFRQCGVPDEALGLTRGKSPSLGIGESWNVSASFDFGFLRAIGLNANAEKVAGALLTVEESGGDAIDFVALSIWLTHPGNLQRLPKSCLDLLSGQDIFLVAEAFRISKGHYELIDKNGARIVIPSAIQTSPAGEIAGALSATNTFEVKDDIYFAFRRLKQLSPGSFTTLGTDVNQVPEADGFLKSAKSIEIVLEGK